MAIEDFAHCDRHDVLPNLFRVEELLWGIDPSFDDMLIATEREDCHEHDDEFSVEDCLEEVMVQSMIRITCILSHIWWPKNQISLMSSVATMMKLLNMFLIIQHVTLMNLQSYITI